MIVFFKYKMNLNFIISLKYILTFNSQIYQEEINNYLALIEDNDIKRKFDWPSKHSHSEFN